MALSINSIQQGLRRAGFRHVDVDGVYGKETRAAVKAFQRQRGLDVDGVVGPETAAALRGQLFGSDRFEPAAKPRGGGLFGNLFSAPRAAAQPEGAMPAARAGRNGTATIQRTLMAGQLRQRVDGTITVNGHSYAFRSGGGGRGSLPKGTYTVTPHRWSRNDPTMSVGGVGYSFAMSNKFDPRVGATRELLRIHPDGKGPGTIGCIGIVGGADVQRRFREDMRAELNRNGGRYTLKVQ